MSAPENPNAFPGGFTGETGFIDGGMTLRDWFAGQVLAGLLASPTAAPSANPRSYAKASYVFADEMLAARAAMSPEPADEVSA